MCGDQVFAKGLEANGYKVTRHDYRTTSNSDLLHVADELKPDLVWFGKCESVDLSIISSIRERLKSAIFVKWAADVRSEPSQNDLLQNKYMDFFFGTFGGDYLKRYLVEGMKAVGSIITFTDSDLFYKDEQMDDWKSDVLFTGRTNMLAEINRATYLNHLYVNNIDVRWYGQSNWIQFPEYRYAISNAKIGLGLGHFIKPLYSSDRLGNYLSCGTFYLSQKFPGIEKVFSQKEIDWFEDPVECLEKIRKYLINDGLRREMSMKAQKKVLQYFDYKPLTKNLLNIIKTGKSDYEFDDVFTN
jgi:hypothetical protein